MEENKKRIKMKQTLTVFRLFRPIALKILFGVFGLFDPFGVLGWFVLLALFARIPARILARIVARILVRILARILAEFW